jgi:putative endonuclease
MVKSTEKQQTGKLGEDRATEFLVSNDFNILARNFRTKLGEIDIVAEKNGIVYCVEVKTRTSTQFGLPSEAITPKKLQRMKLTAQVYASFIGFHGELKLLLIEVLNGQCNLLELE